MKIFSLVLFTSTLTSCVFNEDSTNLNLVDSTQVNSDSKYLGQSVSSCIDQLNDLNIGYFFSISNSNLKVTFLEGGEGAEAGDYFIVPLGSVTTILEFDRSEGYGEGFLVRFNCYKGNCIKTILMREETPYNNEQGWIELGTDFEHAKKVIYLLDEISKSFSN